MSTYNRNQAYFIQIILSQLGWFYLKNGGISRVNQSVASTFVAVGEAATSVTPSEPVAKSETRKG